MKQNNFSKPWKDAINLELKALYAALKGNQNLLETLILRKVVLLTVLFASGVV